MTANETSPDAGQDTPRAPASGSGRDLLRRLFAIRPAGVLRLAVLSLIAGFVLIAADFDLHDPQLRLGHLLSQLAGMLLSAAAWLLRNLWQPLLAGSAVVIPLWILWRAVTLPFRK